MCNDQSTGSLGLEDGVRRITSLPRNNDTETVDPSQRRIVTWQGPVERLFGYHPENIDTNESWWLERIHPDDLFNVVKSLSEKLAPAPDAPYASESRMWSQNYRFKHSNGHYISISERSILDRDEGGNVIGVKGTIYDIERRKQQRLEHRKLLDSKNQFALIANNTPSGIWMMDPHGYTTYMNSAAEKITGFTLDEIYDYTFHDAVHSCRPDGTPYPRDECPIFELQQAGGEAKNQSEVFVHKDGHYYDITYSVAPIGDYASGGAVIEFRDVTEQKKIERERLDAIVQNKQQSALIEASEAHKANMASFVSFVCHELRNPLQGVTSSTEFLMDTLEKLDSLTSVLSATDLTANGMKGHAPPSPASTEPESPLELQRRSSASAEASTVQEIRGLVTYAKELVSNISACASHQALITNNVLDLSRLDAGKVEPLYEIVDLRALCQEAVGMMASRAKVKSINLRMLNDEAQPLFLKADATLMSQILLNLISNAVKFTPEDGNVIVDIYADAPNGEGKVTLHGSVTDDGLGMTEEEQQRLFKRFSQANKKVAQLYQGSGLGLSISKEIVHVMGGDMRVTSSPGKGSTFSFTSIHDSLSSKELNTFHTKTNIPIPSTTTTTTTDIKPLKTSNETTTTPPKFKNILVAEDNPINLTHLSKTLSILQYPHILCTNGSEAVTHFLSDPTIDAVILDMSMPVMSGLEATTLMREHEAKEGRGHTPIIALSGNALREQVEDALGRGASDYIVKPCRRAELGELLKYWEGVVRGGGEHVQFSKRSGR